MRPFLIFAFLPLPALAHPGHLGAVAGHDHWVAGAAIGIALGLGLWKAAKDRQRARSAGRKEASEKPSEEQTA